MRLVDKGIRNVVSVSYSDGPKGAAIYGDDWHSDNLATCGALSGLLELAPVIR